MPVAAVDQSGRPLLASRGSGLEAGPQKTGSKVMVRMAYDTGARQTKLSLMGTLGHKPGEGGEYHPSACPMG